MLTFDWLIIAIYGALLGQRYSLQRIVLLDGPTNRLGNHMSKGRTSVPPWLTYNRSRTRREDYFGLSCTYGGCHACYDAQPIWHDGLRMPGAANFTNESVWVGGGGTMHAAHMKNMEKTLERKKYKLWKKKREAAGGAVRQERKGRPRSRIVCTRVAD